MTDETILYEGDYFSFRRNTSILLVISFPAHYKAMNVIPSSKKRLRSPLLRPSYKTDVYVTPALSPLSTWLVHSYSKTRILKIRYEYRLQRL
jgi:hypothetical protein